MRHTATHTGGNGASIGGEKQAHHASGSTRTSRGLHRLPAAENRFGRASSSTSLRGTLKTQTNGDFGRFVKGSKGNEENNRTSPDTLAEPDPRSFRGHNDAGPRIATGTVVPDAAAAADGPGVVVRRRVDWLGPKRGWQRRFQGVGVRSPGILAWPQPPARPGPSTAPPAAIPLSAYQGGRGRGWG